MDALGEYALSLIVGAMISGILLYIVGKGSYEGLLRFVCGIFLTLALFSPFGKENMTLQLPYFQDILDAGKDQAALGSEMAQETLRKRISSELETYILSKARQRDSELHVMVFLGEDCLPVGVELRGIVSVDERQELTKMIAQELGIPKENQLWIG